ncbi:hypothetical protein RN001_001712 [Aquatica leii]|uniref:Uncharacterized protein n=1 Tax=Aquatica leii TaxID=1421715 RepID=A0AAN7PNX4_9COLE|nr:hypothetical protein RN001_001712 [Aquatica leii]
MSLYKNKHARESALNAIQGAVRHLKPTVSINETKRSLMASSQIFWLNTENGMLVGTAEPERMTTMQYTNQAFSILKVCSFY